VPLKQISERWIDKHKASCLRALTDLTKGLDALKPEPNWSPDYSTSISRTPFADESFRLVPDFVP